jgi:hypothetical protein
VKNKYDKIWDACRDVVNGHCLTGLRDLFDPCESTYRNTNLLEKIEIINAIRQKANCSFKEITDAFLDCYDNESYQHIMSVYPYSIFLLLRQVLGYKKNQGTIKELEEVVDLLCNEVCELDTEIKVNALLELEKSDLELALILISKKNKEVFNKVMNFAIKKIDNINNI